MSTEFIHVAQFLETIFCFEILILIGQRFVMTWKNLDEKYLHQRVKDLQEQIKWQKRTSLKLQPQNHPTDPQTKQQEKVQPPKEEHLRSSLVQNEHNETDRKISSDNNEQSTQNQYKRKSLTDLNKENYRNSNEIEIKDDSEIASERRKSIDGKVGQTDTNNVKIANELDRPQFMDLNTRQPSVMSNNSNHGDQPLRKQSRGDVRLRIFAFVDGIFDQHLPVLMSVLVLGILVQSTFIFAIICLFGYVLTHLLLKYRDSMRKVRRQQNPEGLDSKVGFILPKLWIFALFISYWADDQFS